MEQPEFGPLSDDLLHEQHYQVEHEAKQYINQFLAELCRKASKDKMDEAIRTFIKGSWTGHGGGRLQGMLRQKLAALLPENTNEGNGLGPDGSPSGK